MQSKATSVKDYIAELPDDRRKIISSVRAVIRQHLPKGYEEGMQYGMIGYYVPQRVYPAGYHCNPEQPLPFAALASQKNYVSLYLMCIYSDLAHLKWFQEAWAKTGFKLNIGKGCVRFKKLEQVPLDVIGAAIRRVPVAKFIKHYESVIGRGGAGRKKNASRS